jgi:hypothetical protein
MEAIDNLSSKIVDVVEYPTYSYLIIVLTVITITGIIIYLGNTSSNDLSNSPFSDSTSESAGITILKILVTVIIVIIILWLITYIIKRLFGIHIIKTMQNIFSSRWFDDLVYKIEEIEYAISEYLDGSKPKVQYSSQLLTGGATGATGANTSSPPPPSPPKTKNRGEEVFNVSNNKYTYKDAKSICKAYNARLATYSEIENSYNAGGEWCNYGWSEDQLALFPTQQNTYDKLQKIKGHENDCGRPGVNGGFMEESLKFGVNCYGVKPDMSEKEEQLMKLERIYPKTQSEAELEKQVEYWKEHLDDINVAPFNRDKWNRI